MLNCMATCPTIRKDQGQKNKICRSLLKKWGVCIKTGSLDTKTRDQEMWKTNPKLHGCDNAGHWFGCQRCQDSNAEQESVENHRGSGTPPVLSKQASISCKDLTLPAFIMLLSKIFTSQIKYCN